MRPIVVAAEEHGNPPGCTPETPVVAREHRAVPLAQVPSLSHR